VNGRATILESPEIRRLSAALLSHPGKKIPAEGLRRDGEHTGVIVVKGSSFAPSVIDERTEARQVVVNVKVGPPSKCWLLRLVRLWRRHPDDSPAD